MLLVISDACVLIDIECGELTSAMFSLNYQFAVPDTLFVEELKSRHAHLAQFGLICKTISGDLVAEAYLLHQKHRRQGRIIIMYFILNVHFLCIPI